MTNLEFYKDELKEIIEDVARDAKLSYKWKVVGEAFQIFIKKKSEQQHMFYKDAHGEGAIDWLLAEHKYPIKLKQWEKDLISVFDTNYSKQSEFWSFLSLKELKQKGHFKGITDISMTLQEILDNCEVEDR